MSDAKQAQELTGVQIMADLKRRVMIGKKIRLEALARTNPDVADLMKEINALRAAAVVNQPEAIKQPEPLKKK